MEETKKEGKGIGYTAKCWNNGTTLVIAIPRRIRELNNIETGDFIDIHIIGIYKTTQKTKETKKKETKKQELPEWK